MKSIATVCVLFLVISFCQVESFGQKKLVRQPDDVLVNFAKHALQGSNLQMWLSNQAALGLQAWDNNPPGDYCNPYSGIGCSYPPSACIEHLYGAGPLVGSIINGTRYVTEGYNGNLGYGFFLPEIRDTARDKIWYTSESDTLYDPNIVGFYKVPMNKRGIDDDGDGQQDEDELDGMDNDGDWVSTFDDLGGDGLPDGSENGCFGGYDPVTNPDPAYDNYNPNKEDRCHPDALGRFPLMRDKNLYTEGNGIPDHGEPHVDEDFSAISSSDIYCSYTDTFRTPSYSEHFPQGIKIWQKSYAWNMGSANDAIIMFDYTIVNVGKHTLNDVYVGMFADMDVGPISVSDIAQHNYAGYDSATRTAYIHNPVDIGSTPLGMTLLALSRPLDSVTQIFQWHDFDPPCGDANDSALYSCLSCEAFGNTECIKPDQSSVDLNDTRVVMANGPFGPVVPGDTLKMSYAFISGDNIIDMLNNAIKAHQLKNSIFPNGINKQNEMPLVHKLNQNYPNPFNPSTVIRYQLSANSYVTLKVYDVLGREVASLVNGMQDAGFKIQEWNATGQASGIYFYRLTAGDFVEVKKMLLIR